MQCIENLRLLGRRPTTFHPEPMLRFGVRLGPPFPVCDSMLVVTHAKFIKVLHTFLDWDITFDFVHFCVSVNEFDHPSITNIKGRRMLLCFP